MPNAVVADSSVTMPVPKAQRANASHAFQRESIRLLDELPVRAHRGTYPTGRLAGAKVGNLYAWYIGHSGVIPRTITVDWNAQLARLCQKKKALSRATVVSDTCDMLVSEYGHLDPERMTLAQYQRIADRQSKLVDSSLDWKEVGDFYFSNSSGPVQARKLAALRRMSSSVDGQTLIAYAGAELCPTSGAFCSTFLDFLLRHGGRRYVESIPALNDGLTSFGTFQFTSKAVYDVGNVPTVGSLSRVNRALPRKLRLPASVSLFRGDDNVRGAKLFAIANIAMMIRQLDDTHLATLEGVVRQGKLSWLRSFIATAHNKPQVAYRAADKLIAARMRGSYQDHCPPASQNYAGKASKNYRALGLLASL